MKMLKVIYKCECFFKAFIMVFLDSTFFAWRLNWMRNSFNLFFIGRD